MMGFRKLPTGVVLAMAIVLQSGTASATRNDGRGRTVKWLVKKSGLIFHSRRRAKRMVEWGTDATYKQLLNLRTSTLPAFWATALLVKRKDNSAASQEAVRKADAHGLAIDMALLLAREPRQWAGPRLSRVFHSLETSSDRKELKHKTAEKRNAAKRKIVEKRKAAVKRKLLKAKKKDPNKWALIGEFIRSWSAEVKDGTFHSQAPGTRKWERNTWNNHRDMVLLERVEAQIPTKTRAKSLVRWKDAFEKSDEAITQLGALLEEVDSGTR